MGAALAASGMVAAAGAVVTLSGASGDVTAVELERSLERAPADTRVHCIGRRDAGYACRLHAPNGAPMWANFVRDADGTLRRVE